MRSSWYPFTRRGTALLLLAFAIGFLAAWPALAEPMRPLALPSTVDELVSALLVPGVLGSIVVVGFVTVVRLLPYARDVFAPQPSTDRSVLACRLLAVGVGLAWGAAGLGPLAGLLTDGAEPLAVWLVRVVDGFLVAAAAMVGRDVFTDTGRVGRDLFGTKG